ncbi:MAG: ATP-binding cassette domain-containing protein [Chloroflexi bacterium]|nr:ATP-binding cassette domain-containing protein [Chloroflexota bacterium]
MSGLAIEAEGLRRVYRTGGRFRSGREVVAVENLGLAIEAATVFGLLGPNGAGKTTTVRMLATLLTPTSGVARVLGFDVVRQAAEVRRRMTFVFGGDRGLYGRLTGRENLRYFGALHHMRRREADQRSDELLGLVGLNERADQRVEEYSRGMKQRLHLARGLMPRPEVLFLDEPTIGLDPLAARDLRRLIPMLASQGTTVLLTTHYMQEADQLCDRIALINRGRLVADGTPGEIKRVFSRTIVVEAVLREPIADPETDLAGVDGLRYVDVSSDGPSQRLTIQLAEGSSTAPIESALANNLDGLTTREPTLEEAYLSILR